MESEMVVPTYGFANKKGLSGKPNKPVAWGGSKPPTSGL